MKQRKKVLLLLVCMGIILMGLGTVSTEAATFKWGILGIQLSHEKISFRVEQVEKAQSATVVVMNAQKEEVLSKQFSISNQKEDIVIDLAGEECLRANEDPESSVTSYYVYLKDEQGNVATDTQRAYLYHHNNIVLLATAYPNWLEISKFHWDGLHVSAIVNFQEYEGVQDENGTVIIEYPHQEDGTYVQLKWWDDYGCLGTSDKKVESDSHVSIPSLDVFRESAALVYNKLYSDCRLAVKIGEEVYYSSYGAGCDGNTVEYPEVPANISSVAAWVECKNGSRSAEKTYDISNCRLKDCQYDLKLYLGKAVGTIRANAYGQAAVSVSTTVAGKTYQADVKNGAFTLEYPGERKYNRELVFTDKHGCTFSYSGMVYDSLINETTNEYVYKEDILTKSARAEMPYKDLRLCVKIGGKTYYSQYSNKSDELVRVSYPQQKVGTYVKIWLEHKNTSFTEPATYKIYDRKIKYTAKAKTTSLSGTYFSDIKAKIVVIASGKQYNCKLSKSWDEEGDLCYKFSVSYPRQKVNSYVKIIITDEEGYRCTGSIKLKNIPPKLSVASVDSGSVKITGKTTPGSKVTAQIKGKKYKGKANKAGKYAIKIRQTKVGTKVKVSVVTPEGYTKSKTVKVKLAYGFIDIPNYVFRTSNSISLKVRNGQKGDKIKVNIGGTIYTKTIKKTKKTQNVTVNIHPAAAGTGIVATLCDKFGKVKDTHRDMVYFGDSIYVGMSAEEACLTTWGTPKRNNWGGTIQWVYRRGSTTLYVYIQNGRVAYIQRLNY